MQTKNIAIGIVVFIAAAIGAYMIFGTGLPVNNNAPLQNESDENQGLKSYSSSELGISFQYPEGYLVTEKTVTNSERIHKQIMFIENTPGNQALVNGEVVGEGPTAITIDVFQNDLDKLSASDFIKNNNLSNYKLGNGDLEEGSVDGLKAYRYRWDGLYQGESIVTATEEFVYMFSSTFLGETDKIRTDFYTIVNTSVIKK